MWSWFKRRQTPDKSPRATRDLSPQDLAESARHQDLYALLELFLVKRIETELTLEEKRAEVRLKTAEADAQTKLKLEEIRQQRRQLRASQMAERNRTAPRDSRGRVASYRNVQPGYSSCLACTDPGNPNLTVDVIRHHHAEGHDNGGQRSLPTQPNGTAH